jgi:hypothetical protein
MEAEQPTIQKHVCGICLDEWLSEQEYLDHTCKTGFKPTDPEQMGEGFATIQEAALARGEERKTEEVHPAELAVAEPEVKQVVTQEAPIEK